MSQNTDFPGLSFPAVHYRSCSSECAPSQYCTIAVVAVHYRSCSSSTLSPIAVVHHHLRISFWGRSNPHTRVDSSPGDGDSRI